VLIYILYFVLYFKHILLFLFSFHWSLAEKHEARAARYGEIAEEKYTVIIHHFCVIKFSLYFRILLFSGSFSAVSKERQVHAARQGRGTQSLHTAERTFGGGG